MSRTITAGPHYDADTVYQIEGYAAQVLRDLHLEYQGRWRSSSWLISFVARYHDPGCGRFGILTRTVVTCSGHYDADTVYQIEGYAAQVLRDLHLEYQGIRLVGRPAVIVRAGSEHR
jgi:hypothetical protein